MRRACFYISVAAMVALAVWLTFTGRLQNYLLVSWAVALAALALFFTQYERRRPALQDVMPIVIVVCVASLGRALFNFIPQLQPVTALVMIMGVCSGPPAGFMTGALSALVSNMLLGQGPWTVWQMLAWGLIGLFAGFLGRTRAFRNRWPLAGISVLAGAFYSLVVGIWTVASLGSGMAPGAVLAVFATGLLFSIPHMAGNFVFILLLYRPIAKKLDRVGRKYGILLQKY